MTTCVAEHPKFMSRLKAAINRRKKRLISFLKNPIREVSRFIDGRNRILDALDKLSKVEVEDFNGVGCIIYSKDRPLQLHGLLKSLSKKVENLSGVHIIYNAETEEYLKAYNEVFCQFDSIITTSVNDSSGFKKVLLETLGKVKENRVFFLVDDILFTRNFNLNNLKDIDPLREVFSLRLGEGISYCYMLQKDQPLPNNFSRQNDRGNWTWSNGESDWKYPLSVDGHVFSLEEIKIMTSSLEFKAPNTFEEQLQNFNSSFLSRKGVCNLDSILFNNPCNMVQSELTDNMSGDSNDPKELLDRWNNGFELDLEPYLNLKNKGVHEELPLYFKKRN